MDRISFLPLDLQVSIISLLPFHEAVRTSVLSHQWRSVFTFIDRLTFPSNQLHEPPVVQKWIDVINRHLKLQQAPVRSFDITFDLSEHGPDIDRILAIIAGTLEDLSISAHDVTPHTISQLGRLRSLFLFECRLNLPDHDIWFSHRLEELSLYFPEVTQGTIDTLISRCPRLRVLELVHPYGSESITIRCPLLESLAIDLVDRLHVRIFDAIRLEKADLGMCYDETLIMSQDAQTSRFTDMLAGVANVSSLCMMEFCVEFLSLISLPNRPQWTFRNLTSLELCMDFVYAHQMFVFLLRISPSLRTLIIENMGWEPKKHLYGPSDEDYLGKDEHVFCLEHCLKVFTIRGMNMRVRDEVSVVKFILKKAAFLQRLNITCWSLYDVDYGIHKELVNFKGAASNNVKVRLHETW